MNRWNKYRWGHVQMHWIHYNDVIMGAIASQTTILTIVYSTVYSGADERKHQSSASLDFVRGIHRGPVNSPHKWPVTRKMFPFDDVIMSPYVSVFRVVQRDCERVYVPRREWMEPPRCRLSKSPPSPSMINHALQMGYCGAHDGRYSLMSKL